MSDPILKMLYESMERMLMRNLLDDPERLLGLPPVADRHLAAGFIPKNAYDVRRDAFKVCLGCGSATQPCCGH